LHRVEDRFVAVLDPNAPAQFVAIDETARRGRPVLPDDLIITDEPEDPIEPDDDDLDIEDDPDIEDDA
jgi:hypothetical protein